MSRRERTTALPRPRRRETIDTRPRYLGVPIGEAAVRLAILGGAAALLVLVLGLIGWNWYSDTFRRPNEVILRVGPERVKLSYYADRMPLFFQSNPNETATLNAENLLRKLEEEALALLVAGNAGITITDEDVTNAIAESLGVPVGGPGSSFDTLYRNRLKTLAMDDSAYRRMTKAGVAAEKLTERYTQEIGDTGELVTVRSILVDSREKADELLGRIKNGEDMGTLAQMESADLTSRQQDGVMLPTAPALMPKSIQDAIAGKGEGELVGPIQVQQYWWLVRVEERNPAGVYDEPDKEQLAQIKRNEAIEEMRSRTTIKRTLSASDIDWALENAQ
ncbi:MAG: peptidylprolyl isomerase [Dehalococcoidia bacterium]|nr:hypothetical protein [Chloroflexi bacterium CFX7]MCK6563416.1 peptidylprolyl isomerase [Dehalococcoidia bacterium]NUQ54901.1 peptidylprolyl isomerase [Dehalococcoidia bacterium]RIL03187.1 MAG: hypothetical protein DCC78_03920 [bacterium]